MWWVDVLCLLLYAVRGMGSQLVAGLPGNHEIEHAKGVEDFIAYQSRFRYPSEASGAGEGPAYYSFDAGSAHVIMLNSYGAFDVHSAQYKVRAVQMSAVDRLHLSV